VDKIIGGICSRHNIFFRGQKCPKCKKEVLKRANFTVLPDIKPFVTDNITGKPMEVRSRSHKKMLLKQYGLVEKDPMSSSKNREKFESSPGFKWRRPDAG